MPAAYSEQIKEAVELLATQLGARVLEIGFTMGIESRWLGLQGATVVAIDILRRYLETATRRKQIL